MKAMPLPLIIGAKVTVVTIEILYDVHVGFSSFFHFATIENEKSIIEGYF